SAAGPLQSVCHRDGGPPLASRLAFNQDLTLAEELGMTTLTATRAALVTGDLSAPDPAAERPEVGRDRRTTAPIVVVEADDGTRALISDILSDAGYQVLPTADGIEALAAIKLLRGEAPGVLVVDA